jgi:hypothetical protein
MVLLFLLLSAGHHKLLKVGILCPSMVIRKGMMGLRWAFRCFMGLGVVWTGLATAARADAVLLMEDPVRSLEGRFTSVGHSAVWFDRLCSDDHVTIRTCRPGERGVVVSRYPGLASKQDWLAMPVAEYLFSVDRLEEVPASVTREQFGEMQAAFKAKESPTFQDEIGPKGWTQISGEAYRRRIVMVRVQTTEKQDARVLAWLNARRNVSSFDLFYPNCADFTGDLLGELFPGAFHRSYFFDAGIMTPRQNLASLHEYLARHPEVPWSVSVLPQVPGELPRSGHLRGITEAYLKSWWFLLPLDALDPFELGTVTASGLLDHRYRGKGGRPVGPGMFFGSEVVASR